MADCDSLPLDYPLRLRRNRTYVRLIRLRIIANGKPGPYLDLTGCTAKAEVRQFSNSPVLIELDCTIDPDQVANTGLLEIRIPANGYDAIPEGVEEVGFWDLVIIWPSGDVIPYLAGPVSLEEEITNV